VVVEVAANETVASTNVATIKNIHLNRDVIWVTQKPTTPGEFVVALAKFPAGEPWLKLACGAYLIFSGTAVV
jgi:hypothetical protein